jgi:dCTP deaminase
MRIGGKIARLTSRGSLFDPRVDDPLDFVEFEEGESFVIYPNEHVLLHTVEYIRMPKDLMAFVNLRSSFARIGLILPPTIVDANFEGELTIELIGGNFPIRLYRGDRFLHLVFAKLLSPAVRPYSGKYQGQRGVQIPIFKF